MAPSDGPRLRAALGDFAFNGASVALQNVTEKALTAKQRQAAILTAEDDLCDEKIAESVGVTRMTLHRWRELPAFKDVVAERANELDRQMLRLAIARRRSRVTVLNDLHEKALAVVDARSIEHADVPGGGTGLIVRDIKAVGGGRDAQIVDVYAVDTSLMREIRAIQEQAAKELGQWSEKRELTGAEGGALAVQLIEIVAPPDEPSATDGDD